MVTYDQLPGSRLTSRGREEVPRHRNRRLPGEHGVLLHRLDVRIVVRSQLRARRQTQEHGHRKHPPAPKWDGPATKRTLKHTGSSGDESQRLDHNAGPGTACVRVLSGSLAGAPVSRTSEGGLGRAAA